MPLPPPPAKPAARLAAQALQASISVEDLSAPESLGEASKSSQTPALLVGYSADKRKASKPIERMAGLAGAPESTVAAKMAQDAATTKAARARKRSEESLEQSEYQATQSAAVNRRRKGRDDVKKLFVLDTNVLMHDPTSLFRFEEHDVFLPMTTLEELDRNKKGLSEVARNARQASRAIEALIAGQRGAQPGPAQTGNGSTAQGASAKAASSLATSEAVRDGISLSSTGHKEAHGRLFFQTKDVSDKLPEGLWAGLGDNRILLVVRSLAEQSKPTPVVLVSKDINMRIKAHALGLFAEDYFNDKVLEDTDVLSTGVLELPTNFWSRHARQVESWKEQTRVFYRFKSPLVKHMHLNQFVHLDAEEGGQSLQAIVREVHDQTATLLVLRDYTSGKHGVWGIHARNKEQNFAFNLLLDPDLDLVTLAGQAGTGKTLLALAAGLHQVLESKLYNEIIITRVTVPIGEDIGFLPGSEEEKMSPWMGALDDNLEVLLGAEHEGGEWGRAASSDLVRSRIRVKSLNFMRGRTFLQKFVIIDEAQNLTPKQMKALITRAGPGSKIVCLGNIAQIDTPYLTEGSSGLTYLVDRMRGWRHSGHITLARGERSRLADFASDVL